MPLDELLDDIEKHYKLRGGRGLLQFQSHLKPIRERFADMRAVDVTPKLVDDYIDDASVERERSSKETLLFDACSHLVTGATFAPNNPNYAEQIQKVNQLLESSQCRLVTPTTKNERSHSEKNRSS